jgi:glyoxylase-like metal-dependent hydrolase (beta-lactamase superfamily II)
MRIAVLKPPYKEEQQFHAPVITLQSQKTSQFQFSTKKIFRTDQGFPTIQTMHLQFKVYSSSRASLTRTAPPGLEELKIVPTSYTLIYGAHDAALVDVPLTSDSAREVAEQVAATGKRLKYIYITHPHGDHYFGLSVFLARFPDAKAVASKEAVAAMQNEVKREQDPSTAFFTRLFRGEVPEELVVPEALEGDEMELEGERLVVVRTGHTDTDHTTTLWVPSIGLAVTGDSTYNNVHPFVGESETKALRDEWMRALEVIEGLEPRWVVSGHKDPTKDDEGPRVIEETRRYFANLERMARETGSVEEFYYSMLKLYPGRLNPGSLWGAANVLKG